MNEDLPKPDPQSPPKSSLDILQPKTSAPTSAPTKSQTALFLEQLTIHIASLLNSRDWDHPDLTTYFDPDFSAYMEHTTHPYLTTRSAFIDSYKRMCTAHPGYRYEVADVNASVDEAKNAAVVWFRLRIWGHPEGVEREGVYVGMWRRRKGEWICYRQNGMRGMEV